MSRHLVTASLALGLALLCSPGVRAAEDDVVGAAAKVIEARLPARVDAPALRVAAIEGMTRWLDEQTGVPGNAVLTEAEFQARQARLRGERHGLGIEFTVAAGRGLLVTEVFAGSPSAVGGIAPGDLVVAIDDRPFTGLAGPGIHLAVEGLATRPRGAPVVLDLRREGGALRRLELVPGPFTAPPARVTTDDDRVVVRLDVVGPGVAEVAAAAIEDLGGRALVLDLRDVSDGALEHVVALASIFLDRGHPVLRTVDPAGRTDTLVTPPLASASAPRHAGRLAVLVNRGTSGPAEALASALRADGRALLVGTRTAGRASQPSFHPIGDGLVLQLADTTLLAGDGTTWTGQGLAPDLVVEPIQVPLVGPVRAGFPDIQLETALRYLAAP